jgi:hypothetical protein
LPPTAPFHSLSYRPYLEFHTSLLFSQQQKQQQQKEEEDKKEKKEECRTGKPGDGWKVEK